MSTKAIIYIQFVQINGQSFEDSNTHGFYEQHNYLEKF